MLVGEPVLLMAAIACWTGTLLYLSLLEPAPRNYICLLAAYTLPIVALPTVNAPGSVFAVALTRIEEIVIGIVCASVVSAVVFPVRTRPALASRASGWLLHASRWIEDMLGNGVSPARRHDSFSVLAADIVAIEAQLAQLAYETDGGAFANLVHGGSLQHFRSERHDLHERSVRSSRVTGPKIRVPIGSSLLFSRTAALLSNLTSEPSARRTPLAVRTTTAL